MVGQAERLDVHRLVIDYPLDLTESFDPEADVTDLDWNRMVMELERLEMGVVDESVLDGYFTHASHMKIIDEERFLKLAIREPKWGELESTLLNTESNFGFQNYLDYCVALKILFGDKFVFDSDEEARLVDYTTDLRAAGSVGALMGAVYTLRILAPNNTEVDPFLGKPVFNLIKDHRFYQRDSVGLRAFALVAFPRFAGQVKTTREDWQKSKAEMLPMFPYDFAEHAYNMTIAAADRVVVDKGGLHLVPPERTLPEPDIGNIPQIRRF